jgi:hypothetical protein
VTIDMIPADVDLTKELQRLQNLLAEADFQILVRDQIIREEREKKYQIESIYKTTVTSIDNQVSALKNMVILYLFFIGGILIGKIEDVRLSMVIALIVVCIVLVLTKMKRRENK